MESFLRNSKLTGVPESIFHATLRGRFSSALLSAALIAGSQGCSSQPASPKSAVQNAVELQEAGEYDAAIEALTAFLKSNPESAEAYFERGNCYAAKADLPNAISDLESACDNQPSWDRAWRALGNAERADNHREEALQYLTNAIELNPEAADSRFDRGCLLLELGQKQFALEDFRHAAELAPEHSQALLRCAILESETDQIIALDRFAEVLRIDRHSSEAWMQRGLLYEKMGNLQRALGDITVASRLNEESAIAWSHQGRLLLKLDQRDEAIVMLNRAAELAPENTQIQQLLLDAQNPQQSVVVADNSSARDKSTVNISNVSMPEVLSEDVKSESAAEFLSFPVVNEVTNVAVESTGAVEGTESNAPPIAFESFPLEASPEPVESIVGSPKAKTDGDYPLFPLDETPEATSKPAVDVPEAIASESPEQSEANPFVLNIAPEAIADVPRTPVPTAAVETAATENVNPFAEALFDEPTEPAKPIDVTPTAPVDAAEVMADDDSVAGVVSAENTQPQSSAPHENEVDTEALYQRALAAYRKGDRTASVAAFELLLDADPDHHAGRFRYANVLAETGEPEEALIVCTPLVQNAPENTDYAYFRAQVLSQLKSYDEAAAEYTRLLSLGSRHDEGLTARAKVYLAAERWEDAANDLTELLRRQPNDVFLLKQRAKAQERLQAWSLAIADWTQIGLIEPSNVEAMESRANAFLRMGENAAAISDLTSIIRFQPENIRIATKLAELHATLEHWPEVAAVLTPLVQRQQADTASTFLRAQALVNLKDDAVALSDLNHVISTDPNHAAALGLRAKLLANIGDTREALEDLNLATKLTPENMSLIQLRAQIYAASGDHKAAISDLTKLITQNPRDTEALLARAEIYQALGNGDSVRADVDSILKIEPSHYRALVLRGDGLFARKQFDQAAIAYGTAIEQENSDPELLWRRCQCRLHVRQEVLAARDLDAIIKLNPQHNNALLTRARLQEKSGIFDGAVEDLSRVLQDRPDAFAAWASRGTIHHRTGRFEEAVHDLSRAIQIQPENADMLYRRGLSHHQLGDPENALKDLSNALKLQPANSDYIYSRGNVHASLGETKKATADYRQAVKQNPEHSAAWYNLGNLLFAQEQFADAVTCWDEAIAIQPGLFRAYNNRAAACVQLKRYQQAIDDYETTISLNPEFAKAYDNYAFLLATSEDPQFHDPETAIVYATKACELSNNQDWTYLSTLAAAYAETGDYETAKKWLGVSHKVAPEAEKPQLLQLARIYESERERNRTAQQPSVRF